MTNKFRKRPVEVEANQFTEGYAYAIADWINDHGGEAKAGAQGTVIAIYTLEGTMRADIGDWVIKGVKGEFYPCKPDIFEATYEPADPPPFNPDPDLMGPSL